MLSDGIATSRGRSPGSTGGNGAFDVFFDGISADGVISSWAERIILDPGIGFAKTAGQNLVLLRRIEQLSQLGRRDPRVESDRCEEDAA